MSFAERRTRILGPWLTALLALSIPALAASDAGEVEAFRGARIHPVAQPVIERGAFIVEQGRIAWIGDEVDLVVPEGAEVHDLGGRVVIPGLVDSHSHIGILSRPLARASADANELTGPVQAQLRAIDAIFPDDPGIRMAQAGGITTVNIMPGSGNVVGGQTAYVKLRGDTIEEMLAPLPEGFVGGLKMANGENTKLAYGGKGKSPQTRMAIAAKQRALFQKAREYGEKWDRYEDAAQKERGEGEKRPDPPSRDLSLDPIVEVLERRRTVHHHTHRADDIATVLRLQRDYDLDLVIQHGSEAWRLADEIAAAGVPVSAIMLDSPGGKLEASYWRAETPAILERAGARVAIHTDDMVTPSRLFLRSAAMAVRAGMSERGALDAITLEPARMLHLEERIGSLEVGKDADFVVLSGEPFSVYTQVLETWIEGEKVFDRSDPKQRRFATGGFMHPDRHPDVAPSPHQEQWP